MTRARGRPRKFDHDEALQKAGELFWTQGYSGTSLDQLAETMQINRPSLYNAFGDKKTLYRSALAQFCGQLDQGIEQILSQAPNLRSGLRAFYEAALEVYCASELRPGCMMICTAPAEAIAHPEIREDLHALLTRTDNALARRIKRAMAEGELSRQTEPKQSAKIAQAVLHSLALRARAGESRASLKRFAHAAVDIIFT